MQATSQIACRKPGNSGRKTHDRGVPLQTNTKNAKMKKKMQNLKIKKNVRIS
jgi:hypothetical protein